MVNKFRNGAMDVWQRGTSSLAVGATAVFAYTADGWMAAGTYSSGSGPVVSQGSGRLLTKNSLTVTGAANVTDVKIRQRIESLIAAAFCSQTVTVQAQVYNNTGGSIAPTLTVNRPSAQDNYASVTADVNAVSLQACANGAWTRVAYTFSANAASYDGLEISFDFGNNFSANTQSIQITECDIRVTPGAATGLNANPPPPELRPIFSELPFNQRYYEIADGQQNKYYVVVQYAVGTTVGGVFRFAVTKRAAPTIAFSAAASMRFVGSKGGVLTPGITGAVITTDSFQMNSSSTITATAPLFGWFDTFGVLSASAEL